LRYLVTGGAGFVGSHVVDALAARGDQILILDDLSTGSVLNIEHLMPSPLVEFVKGSVLDEPLVDDCMRSVDCCFHLASAVGVRLVVDRALDSLLENVRGTDVVMSAAARHGCRLVYTSTSEIYGKKSGDALDETSDRVLGSPAVARWSYATAKAFGEAAAHGYHREHGAHMVIARLFNTVGARQTGRYGMVLPSFVRQALAGQDLTVYGSGTQTRCFTHVLDTVDALLLLADAEEASGKCYNVGSCREVPVFELADRVIERTGSDSRTVLVPYEHAYGDGFEELGRRVPDTTALQALTGWQPSTRRSTTWSSSSALPPPECGTG
jgi:UDP-glucose 4-epimerase